MWTMSLLHEGHYDDMIIGVYHCVLFVSVRMKI
jgi:hypothetical protein